MTLPACQKVQPKAMPGSAYSTRMIRNVPCNYGSSALRLASRTKSNSGCAIGPVSTGGYWAARAVCDEGGSIVRWMGTSTDIHEQKLAQEALKESDRRKDGIPRNACT